MTPAGQITLLDLGLETSRSALPTKPTLVKRLRESHHDLAMKVADGYSNVECAALTGYAPQTVSQLRDDKGFQELVQHYKDKKSHAYIALHERIAACAGDAIETLHDKVREEELTVGQLVEISKLTLDRSGYGPQSQTQNLNINATVPVDMLQRVKSTALQRGEVRRLGTPAATLPPVIEGQAIPQDQGRADSRGGTGLALGAAPVHPEGEKPARVAGQGQGV